MIKNTLTFLFALFFWAACAVPKQSAPLSPVDPSSPDAPEAADAPPTRALMTKVEKTAPLSGERSKPVQEDAHHQHGQPSPPGPETPETEAIFACPMHPEIKQDQPGRCSICGMRLARQETEKEPPQ